MRRRMEQAVPVACDRPVRMKRSSHGDARQVAGAVPGHSVRFDKDHQTVRCNARHVLDPSAGLACEQSKVCTVDVHTEQADTTKGALRQTAALPTGKQQTPVLHKKRVHVARQIVGQSPNGRTVQLRRVKVCGRSRSVFVSCTGGVTDERQLVPRLPRDDRVQRRLVSRAAAVAHVPCDLADARSIKGHLEDVPIVRRFSFAGKQHHLPIERNLRVASAVKPGGQHANGPVWIHRGNACAVPIRHAERPAGSPTPIPRCRSGGKLREEERTVKANTSGHRNFGIRAQGRERASK